MHGVMSRAQRSGTGMQTPAELALTGTPALRCTATRVALASAERNYNPNIAFAMMFFWISFEPP